MKIVLLDTLTFGDTDLSAFDDLGDVVSYLTTTQEELHERIANASVIVTNKVVIDSETMDRCNSLKLICVAATGMNNIDLDAASKKEIVVKNVVGYSTDSVVQHTFSMLFYLLGKSRYYDEYVKSGSWCKSEVFTHIGSGFSEIKGKKWGVIGFGEIGKGVAKVASAFGADVYYYSTSGKNSSSEYESITLSRLLESCDIISIHAPLNPQTEDLIGHSELLMMRDGAVLLNLGRGGIVNEDALSAIIDVKPIYVGLDVLQSEPMRGDSALLNIKSSDRLYITPHIAWTSVEARERLIGSIAKSIREFCA